MKTTVQIPLVLQVYCDGQTEFDISGKTVGEILQTVKTTYPRLYGCICDETDQVRQHINLFLNDKLLIVPAGFKTQIKSGDVVSVFQSVSGG